MYEDWYKILNFLFFLLKFFARNTQERPHKGTAHEKLVDICITVYKVALGQGEYLDS